MLELRNGRRIAATAQNGSSGSNVFEWQVVGRRTMRRYDFEELESIAETSERRFRDLNWYLGQMDREREAQVPGVAFRTKSVVLTFSSQKADEVRGRMVR